MDVRSFLGFGLLCAAALAACAESTDALTDGTGNAQQPASQGGSRSSGTTGGTTGTTPDPDAPGPIGNVPTNSPAGKEFYKANVFPFMSASCGTCHNPAGPGPNWITSADPERSYLQLFSQGYVMPQSRVTVKGVHGGVTTNVLTGQQIGIYEQWVSMEIKDGGTKSLPNVLEKLGSCFDRAKFDAMQMGQWRTTQRTNNNNVNNVNPWNENANNCTGCNNAPCTVCHSADAATNFNNAVGNALLPPETTFENTKLTQPAYITKFFGVSPDGKPIESNGIKKKSDATMKDKAYTHPMFTLNAQQQAAVTTFVTDVITKYNAGTCGK